MRTRARFGFLGLLLLIGCLGIPAGAVAGEDELDMAFFRVGALTSGFGWHWGEVPPPTSFDDVRSEETPLFGGSGEMAFYPVGQVDELIEIVKSLVEPADWETIEGADIRSSGESQLVVRAPRRLINDVATFLAELEARKLRTVTVTIRAVPDERDAEPAPSPDMLAARPDAVSVSLTALDRQHASAMSGSYAAYMAGYHASIAQGASLSTPIVEVANLGLIATTQVALGRDASTAMLDAKVDVVDLEALERRDVGEGRSLEAPRFRHAALAGTFELPVGAWHRMGAEAGWTLLARVEVHRHEAKPRVPPSVRLRAEPAGGFVARMLDVGEHVLPRRSRYAGPSIVTPTGYAPPEPCELPEPAPIFAPEHLVELIRELTGPGFWQDPATMEARNGMLILRNRRSLVDEVEQHLLGTILAESFDPLVLDVHVLDMPRGAAALFEVDPSAAMRADGVQRVEHAAIRIAPPATGAVGAGRVRRYVGDYTPMIACEAATAKPVTFELREGLSVMATAELLSTADAAHVQLHECQQAEHPEPLRSFATPCGAVELPRLRVQRMRGGFVAALGRPTVVSVATEGEHARVIVMTVRRDDARAR